MSEGYLHLPSGLSGDIFLGALLDAGASLESMNRAVAAAAGPEVSLHPRDVTRAGLRAVHVTVHRNGIPIREDEPASHDHGHGHGHGHDHATPAAIEARLRDAGLSPFVAVRALAAFRALAGAESRVHGRPVSDVHFHEVGTQDAVADIVGTAAGLESLGVVRLFHGPVAVGGGTVRTAHGTLPVPAPATLALLEGRTCVFEEGRGELTTPTGAALLVTLAEEASAPSAFRPTAAGYGAGSRDPAGYPNLARLVVGAAGPDAPCRTRVAVVEASLDDCTPEEGAYLVQDLMGAGALDASLTPLIMKKGRPGFLVRVLASPEAAPAFAERLVHHSSSLGARWRVEERLELARRIETVQLADGEVRVKVAVLADGSERMHAEYEDLAALAGLRGVPLARIRGEVETVWRATRKR